MTLLRVIAIRARTVLPAVLLPALLAALAFWALPSGAGQVAAAPAAVVDLDRPVWTGTGGDRQVVAAGRLLAADLTSPDRPDEAPLEWVLTDAGDARSGLADGRYSAVVTIPHGFSRTVAGLTRGDPHTATFSVRTADAADPVTGLVSAQLAHAAADRVGHRITAVYLEGVYTRTVEFTRRLGQAASGAERLAAGAGRLQQGVRRAGGATTALTDGLVRLGDGARRVDTGAAAVSDGAGSLADGMQRLTGGARRLGAGAGALSAGASRLADGAHRLADGSRQTATGAVRLADGLTTLDGQTRQLPDRTRALADGAARLRDGVAGYASLLTSWSRACTADPVLAGSHAQLCAATLQAVGPTGGNAEALTDGARQLAEGTDRLADAAPRLAGAVHDAASGGERLAQGTTAVAGGAVRIEQGAARLADGASTLGAGADRLATGTAAARAGAGRLATGADRLRSGTSQVASGAGSAAHGAGRLAAGTARLAAGSDRLRHGTGLLAERLGDGADQLTGAGPSPRKLPRAAQVAAAPVDAVTTPGSSADDPGHGTAVLAPGVVVLLLWLGAFGVFLVRRALPTAALTAAVPPLRVVRAGLAPALATVATLAPLLLAVTAAFGVPVAAPVAAALFLLVAAVAFAAVVQALVATLGGRRGALAVAALSGVQLLALTGTGGIDRLGFLPVPLAAGGLRPLLLGGPTSDAAAATLGLVVWAVAAVATSTVAARRRQRMTLSDVRRSVAVLRA